MITLTDSCRRFFSYWKTKYLFPHCNLHALLLLRPIPELLRNFINGIDCEHHCLIIIQRSYLFWDICSCFCNGSCSPGGSRLLLQRLYLSLDGSGPVLCRLCLVRLKCSQLLLKLYYFVKGLLIHARICLGYIIPYLSSLQFVLQLVLPALVVIFYLNLGGSQLLRRHRLKELINLISCDALSIDFVLWLFEPGLYCC